MNIKFLKAADGRKEPARKTNKATKTPTGISHGRILRHLITFLTGPLASLKAAFSSFFLSCLYSLISSLLLPSNYFLSIFLNLQYSAKAS